jgi:hypothetical protein
MGVKIIFNFLFYFYLICNSFDWVKSASLTNNNNNNSVNYNNAKPKISSINGKCLENSECWIGSDNNRVCVDNKCQCKPNYYFDYINNQCKYFTCRLDKDCQSYDSHRICDAYDNCKCENGFGQDSVSNKCVILRMMGSPCVEDSDCWTLKDFHRVCRENSCHCKHFYKYEYNERKCVAKNVCDFDKDCQKYDMNRVCDEYGLCSCKSGYFANSISDKCKKFSQKIGSYNEIDSNFGQI